MSFFKRRPKEETLTLLEAGPGTLRLELVTAAGGYRAHVLPFTIEQVEQILLDAAQPPTTQQEQP